MIGEVYTPTNVSSQPMVLAEEEFDRDGDAWLGGDRHHNLRPGDSTNVYVLRAGS
jgi:conjugal transfer pilus assembly protein TraK